MIAASATVVLLACLGSWLLNKEPFGRPQVDALRLLVAERFPVNQNIHILFENTGLRFPDLVTASQMQLDHILQQQNILFRYTLIDDLAQEFDPFLSVAEPTSPMLITLDATESLSVKATVAEAKERTKPTYSVALALSDSVSIYHDIFAPKVIMGYDLNAVHKNDMPFFVTQAIIDHLLAVDFSTAKLLCNSTFADYSPRLEVNFVAVEELGDTPSEIVEAIRNHFAEIQQRLSPFAKLDVRFVLVDVTKNRLRPANTKNSTQSLNFVYLTSLLGFADEIQGVPIRHLTKEKVERLKDGEVLYGTELLERQRKLDSATYNITSFVQSAQFAILSASGLPMVDSENLAMRAESAMKYYTITGIVGELDRITQNLDKTAFLQVAKLVDHILTQDEHDWHEYLLQVGKWHGRAG